MKIALVGIYPPPYGGRSIHIKRLNKRFEKDGVTCTVYENSGVFKKENNVIIMKSMSTWLIDQLLHGIEDVIHCHNYSPKSLILFSLLSILKDKKIIFTLHSFRYSLKDFDLWSKFAFWLATRVRVYFIAVSPEIKEKIVSLGVKSEYVEVIPAFIPPALDEMDVSWLPESLQNIRKKYKFLITANAFRISFYNDYDLYGIDLSIELMKRLVDNGYRDIGFIYVIPDIGDYEYFEKMKKLIEKYDLKKYFHFHTEPVAYPAVINLCDMFIRPTNTDGDALSIREALTLKKPTITSDVCKRPEGTILFEKRSVDSLYFKTIQVIENYDEEKKRIENIKFEDNAEKILEVYKKVLDKQYL